ncbi:MAG: hypothetical protein Q8P56_05965, partial [Candidatus Uhrbacteria bacterium]|nr:hypothetical protein [Candidatus Uhrbacteria bacterium]
MYHYYISRHFKKLLKPYLRKHRSLLDDIIALLNTFDKRTCVALGAHTYKTRLASRDLSRGKSGSFRMIILLLEVNYIIAPLVIYLKSERPSISQKEITQ